MPTKRERNRRVNSGARVQVRVRAERGHDGRRRTKWASLRICVHACMYLVEGGGEDQVLCRVEASRHDVVAVACQHLDTRPRLPVPDADRLVVAGRDDPWQLCR